MLTPRDGRGTSLRVSVYAAPRRASTMAAATSAKVTSSSIGTGTLALSGNGFGTGASTAVGQLRQPADGDPAAGHERPAAGLLGVGPHRVRAVRRRPRGRHPLRRHVLRRAVLLARRARHRHLCRLRGDSLRRLPQRGASRPGGRGARRSASPSSTSGGTSTTTTSPDAVTLNTRLADTCPDDPTKLCDTDQLVAQTYLPCHQSDPSDCALFAERPATGTTTPSTASRSTASAGAWTPRRTTPTPWSCR